jgi:hypothetical protein
MYIKHPYISRYNKNPNKIDDLPRFHLFECSTIYEQRSNNNFDHRYFWSNSPLVSVFDFDTNEEFPQRKLKLCWNCKRILEERIGEYIEDTKDFHKLLEFNDKQQENNEEEQQTDFEGYTFDWRKISRIYRETVKYTCENCGFGDEYLQNNYDKRYIEVHHIDGNKTNNKSSNLKALCSLCHIYQDDFHENKLDNPRIKRKILNFVRKYKKILIDIGNPNINKFLNEFGNEL